MELSFRTMTATDIEKTSAAKSTSPQAKSTSPQGKQQEASPDKSARCMEMIVGPGPENYKSVGWKSTEIPLDFHRSSSGFCPMRVELREAKILPNKDCLFNNNNKNNNNNSNNFKKRLKAILVVW